VVFRYGYYYGTYGTVAATYEIEKVVNGRITDSFDISPSIYKGYSDLCSGIKEDTESIKTIDLICRNSTTKELVSGCKVKVSLSEGDVSLNGGHNSSTHLGDRELQAKRLTNTPALDLDLILDIPLTGLSIKYPAPETSGQVKMKFQTFDPQGRQIVVPDTVINVKSAANLNKAILTGLNFSVKSHPGNGDYLTPAFSGRVATMISKFRQLASLKGVPDAALPILESQGASLNWGGLFDTDKDWHPSHCGHRRGDQMDLSLTPLGRVYRQQLKDALEEAAKRAKLEFPYISESPLDPNANHWHVGGVK
jgi:hypothetical protein